MTAMLALLGCVLLLATWPAHAGVLYRCAGAQGEVVFTSSKASYRECRQIASFQAVTPSHAGPRRDLSSHVSSLAWVTGWVETTAKPVAPIVVSLDRVLAGVETTARAAPSPATGKPGQWTYNDSRGGLSAALADSGLQDSPDSRVLRGAVYRVVHRDGSVEYTNIPQGGAQASNVTKLFSYIATCMACNLHSNINWGTVALNLDAYRDVIREA
ncbi:MAG TPA: lytic transglycosylase domain-containing protein, partial [Rhodanobacter sp.]